MKTIATLLIFALFSISTYSQNPDEIAKFKKNFYLERSKKQNTTGWILLGGGTALTAVGLASFDRSWDYGTSGQTDFWGFAVLTGIVADLVGIPMLISAGVNRRRAKNISITISSINSYSQQNVSMLAKPLPGLTLQIRF